jgi:hypothetical protein
MPEKWQRTTSLALARVVPDLNLRVMLLLSVARSVISKNSNRHIWIGITVAIYRIALTNVPACKGRTAC